MNKPKSPASRKKRAAKAAPKHPLMINGKDWDKNKVVAYLCDQIATSSKSLGSILNAGFEGKLLPSYSTVALWLSENSALSDMYARAREGQADFMADEFAEIHEKAWVPVLSPDGQPILVDGKPLRTVDKASAAAARLEADNKKWLMSKLKPKKYGDKIQVGGADDLPPMKHDVTLSPDEAYMRMLGGSK